MQDNDPELRRLKEIERLARERFLRLSLPGSFGGDAEVIKARKTFGGKRLPRFAHTGINDGSCPVTRCVHLPPALLMQM
jgi:hypothetical protein